MTIAAAAEDDWLSALAASRQQVAGGAPNSSSSLTTSRDAHGRLVVTTAVRLSPPSLAAAAPSTVAAETSIAQLLLQAFVEQGAAVPRGVEVAVIDAPPAADADAAGVWRHVSFTATEPAAEEQVQEAAGLFEAYFQFHLKATKSDLHCRMRQRLTTLQQQLQLARFDA